MRLSLSHIAWGLTALSVAVVSEPVPVPHYFQREALTRRDLSVSQVSRELGALVSNTTAIFGPSDPRWENATERYTTFAPPTIELVVQPGLESDIPIIIKYCNRNSIEFMAVNRGHSLTITTGRFKGIEIDMASLRDYTIEPDFQSAWFQGGSYGGSVISSLWDQGYVATTGSCTCVGLLGPGLGGGHGRFEGQYGLVSDNLVNLNVVLADGSAIRVNATSHSDLWWALQGAGHNFALVTSFQMKIHPRKVDTWHYHNYVWSGDKLETVFEQLNIFHTSANGTTPVLMAVNFGEFGIESNYSSTEAVLEWSFVYAGPAADAEALLAPFNAIEALSEETGDVPYPDIADIQGTGLNSAACVPGYKWALRTAGSVDYNITAERQIYDTFNRKVAQYPDLALGARVTHEGYSNAAMKQVDAASTAVSYRAENHLLYIAVDIPEGSNLTAAAMEWADETRALWNQGQPGRQPSTYVNYAFGDEPVASMYGYEPWRLARLRALKQKYDPHNRFRFYNPFV
ncbi:FAD binding domain-containing protein [Aspergillus uvarum CBS 121591]|uniref:FAD binding domain-containing protein n=1 Tax=Aspergillus uvarum CBS 121591 TaxID=1448315 RepID=A0A319C133_9EURO|nr:FAD binding domain-containing protein [Aspergillus uvarum CBS 121591]PYH77480.1 FAD binding domain-containing protein [Aspergillus uvarum CBS 121591]